MSILKRPVCCDKKSSRIDWARLAGIKHQEIDISDSVELNDDFFRNATLRVTAKQAITIHIDADVLEGFKRQGYQIRCDSP